MYIYLSRDTIQRLNCVMGYFNVKPKQYLVDIIDLQIFDSIKLEHAWGKWTC